jgi:hypothetical protein
LLKLVTQDLELYSFIAKVRRDAQFGKQRLAAGKPMKEVITNGKSQGCLRCKSRSVLGLLVCPEEISARFAPRVGQNFSST